MGALLLWKAKSKADEFLAVGGPVSFVTSFPESGLLSLEDPSGSPRGDFALPEWRGMEEVPREGEGVSMEAQLQELSRQNE